MTSPLLALFNRSLRQDVRAKSTYWARAGLVSMMLVMMFTTHLSLGWSGAPGLAFFSSAIYTNFFFISLAGLSYFASAITEEKEEMTLGLLRMTNLNPLSILLGKSTSRLFGALLLLATQVPFTLLAVSFGGVSISQIVAVYCALAAFIIFLSNLALLFSVMSARTAGAAVKTGVVLFLFFVGPSWTLGLRGAFHYWGWIADAKPGPALTAALEKWEHMSPLTRFGEVLTTGFNDSPIGLQFWSNIALGTVSFLLAWAVFELFCRDQKDAVPRRGFVFKRTSNRRLVWAVGGSANVLLSVFGAGRPWRRTLIWKDFYFVNGGKFAAICKFLGYGLVGITLIWTLATGSGSGWQRWTWAEIGLTTMGISALVLALELVIVAGRVFRVELRWKTLSSLAMLPISLRRVAYHKVLGCLLACLPAAIYFVIGFACASPEMWRSLHKWWEWKEKVGLDRALKAAIEWEVIGGFAFAFMVVIFLLHLTSLFSLRFKWGALPMAVAATWAGCMFAVPLAFYMFKSAAFIALISLLVVVIGVLHVRIGARLEQLAAEE